MDSQNQSPVYYDLERLSREIDGREPDEPQRLGGMAVDKGERLPQSAEGKTEANSTGRVIAIAKRGQEEVFSHVGLPLVLPVSADDLDEAAGHARRHLQRAGLTVAHFYSFDATTHYYLAPLGKRECGWSFSFKLTDI